MSNSGKNRQFDVSFKINLFKENDFVAAKNQIEAQAADTFAIQEIDLGEERELGFVFVDDGHRTFQLSESLFFQILGSSRDGPYAEGAMAYTSVFLLFPTPDEARQSVQNKEI